MAQNINTMGISIHALREESDMARAIVHAGDKIISIHALREESDGETLGLPKVLFNISIHALREESDCLTHPQLLCNAYFYPRSP